MRVRLVGLCLTFSIAIFGQNEVTDPFKDLERGGIVQEEHSIMRQAASIQQINGLLAENPQAGFFCFTEDRRNDIRLSDALPALWLERTARQRLSFSGTASPGEFYTWQLGLFAPYRPLVDVEFSFSDFVNAEKQVIKASACTCINTDWVDHFGTHFHSPVQVGKGKVQAFWMGIDLPKDACGTYRGEVRVRENGRIKEKIDVEITVSGEAVPNGGDNEGWRKSRLRWLNSEIGLSSQPTAPYVPLHVKDHSLSWLGGEIELGPSGLPVSVLTRYDANNNLSENRVNQILAGRMEFVIETEQGTERLRGGRLRITDRSDAEVSWECTRKNSSFEVNCRGVFGFDGIANMELTVESKTDVEIKDMRLEIPYTAYASRYMMGLGHKGGYRPDTLIRWHWDVEKQQDKIWMGNVNAGLNLRFKDENFVRPLVNIYYKFEKLRLPDSWGNGGKGGITICPTDSAVTRLVAYSGGRSMKKGERLHFNFDMQVTPSKPLDLKKMSGIRFYHSNSDVSASYIPEAKKNGANYINIHHKKDVYPFINYPYSDQSVEDLKNFIAEAHRDSIGVRVYYTTRELTAKIPELWAFRSLGDEVIHDGPGKDARTMIHKNGPNEWLVKNLGDHFIPAWYNAFKAGKYKGDMDISVITTPDSRFNNYYLAGLDWMVKNLGIDGIYLDDSALDRKTIQRARRILDRDGRERIIDLHSWNHMRVQAGFGNSLHIYSELLPYVDLTWIGEGFSELNTPDFWLVEMSGIPFGLMGQTLQARNQFRGMVLGMLPRLPWSGNPVPLWNLWDKFGMENAAMYGYWDEGCPVKTNNPSVLATVYKNGDKLLVALANWSDLPQKFTLSIDKDKVGFQPTKYILPEIKNLQWEGTVNKLENIEVMGRGGMIIWVE